MCVPILDNAQGIIEFNMVNNPILKYLIYVA